MTKPFKKALSSLVSAFSKKTKGSYSELKSLCEFLMLQLPDATRHGEVIKVNYHADKNFGDRIALHLSENRGMLIGCKDGRGFYAQHIMPGLKDDETCTSVIQYDSLSDLVRTETQRMAMYLSAEDAQQLTKDATDYIRRVSGNAQAAAVTLATSPALLKQHSTQTPMVMLYTFLQSTLNAEDRHGNVLDLSMRGNKGATIMLKIGEDHSINITRGEDGRCLIQRQLADPEFKGGGFLMTSGTGSAKDPEMRIHGAAKFFTEYVASFLANPESEKFLNNALNFIAFGLDDTPPDNTQHQIKPAP